MDFYRILSRREKGVTTIFPDFVVARSNDLMIRGKSFYAIWDPDKSLWSDNEYDVQRLVDDDLREYAVWNHPSEDTEVKVQYLGSFSSGRWSAFQAFVRSLSDNATPLDTTLTFADTPVRKDMYVSKRLPYSLGEGDASAWERLISVLYAPVEREKIEWTIGSIVAGDSKWIQKFIVLYGASGSGKSTILNIVQRLFQGYCGAFSAKALGNASDSFAMEPFKRNPLVAVDHDGDLSRLDDNTRLNSIVSHEMMLVNEKNKPLYEMQINSSLWVGTNKPVKITDAKSGLTRRLIDVVPTGDTLPSDEYLDLMAQIMNNLGAVAQHCLEVYKARGPHYYDAYKPQRMMIETNFIRNFVGEYVEEFTDGISLKRAYALYREYCDESAIQHPLSKMKFRDEFMNYFREYSDRKRVGTSRVSCWFDDFRYELISDTTIYGAPETDWLSLEALDSRIDGMLAERPAQYANDEGYPVSKWDGVSTVLADLDTSRLHYVRPPENHIVIDFDLKDASGEKSQELNIGAARAFPKTYAEWSKSGSGLHLHYIYDGDVSELASEFSKDIEVKVFRGRASLRRRLSRCNDVEVAHISSGLPLKERKSVINAKQVASEKALRDLVERNLRKEVHPGTKPSMDFIKKILDDAYASDLSYDLSDMRNSIMTFAIHSTNQKQVCLKIYAQLKLKSKDIEEGTYEGSSSDPGIVSPVFFDIEVYPNLFMVSWMRDHDDAEVVTLINPSAEEVGKLFEMPLVGFNNRKYDNHIMYHRYMGGDNKSCFNLSQRIINKSQDAMITEAYNVSYTDVYDFSTKKQSLKAWEVELGLPHMEMSIPWDQPVPEELVSKVAEYNQNDVRATRAVWHARQADWEARQILAKVSGLTVNHTTNQHTQQIIFGKDKNPPFFHHDLTKDFPGYSFKDGVSTYRGETVGEGGYVYQEEGYYENVALLDIASMHPHSLIAMECFGPKYTKRFKEIVDARIAVKKGDKKGVETLLGGALRPFAGHNDKALAFALKIAINSVYGLTAAKFPTRCNGRDPSKNPDNIVAKRGALFMIDLKHELQSRGAKVVHIKTDSVKIVDATPEIIDFVMEFGKKWGYFFEEEAVYERFLLVNKAVYLAKDEDGWDATGAQFQHPYVYNHFVEGRDDTFADFVETRQVIKGALHLNYGTPENPQREFLGRISTVVPVIPDTPGGDLEVLRDGKFVSAPSAKGFRWAKDEDILNLANKDGKDPLSYVDRGFAEHKMAEAWAIVNKYVEPEVMFR